VRGVSSDCRRIKESKSTKSTVDKLTTSEAEFRADSEETGDEPSTTSIHLFINQTFSHTNQRSCVYS
jgi:hypothetical protein